MLIGDAWSTKHLKKYSKLCTTVCNSRNLYYEYIAVTVATGFGKLMVFGWHAEFQNCIKY
jgi:hypothetical protein